MSNERKLLVYRDSKLILEFALSGDSVTIGRGDACDVVLESESVSRMHAKVIIQEEALYLENQSSTGQLFVDSNQVEMAEWPENSEAKIGPFVLRWAFGEAKKSATPKASAAVAAPAPAPSESSPSNEANASAPAEAPSNFGFGGEWASPPAEESPEALSLVNNNEEENVNFAVAEVVDDEDSDDNDDSDESRDMDPHGQETHQSSAGEASYVDQDGSTRISSTDAIGVLKVTQGETIGREIKLDQGFQWIVGRSSKCHVKIDNNKLSRQHFKIVKVGGRYRVQDLGSANGTRLNGIAVTDAPLSPFDTIVAGPVEFQFLIAQSHLENAPALAGAAAQPFSSQETTQFAPPPMVYSGDGANPFEHAMHAAAAASDKNASGGATNASAGIFANTGKTSAGPHSLSGKASLWWNAQPKNKRLIYVGTLAILLAVLLMPGEEAPSTAPTTPVAATGESANTAAATPAPDAVPEQRSENISPEFYLLNPEERRKIEDAYARAQRARNAGNWKEAVEQSKEVLKYVDRYKDIADILAESQTHFNDIILGAVTKDLKNSLDAEAQTTEQVNLLIEAGKKAIAETRWTDAQEQCAKAVSLDPRNEEANKCFAAAYGQNANFIAEKPPVEVAVPTDPDLERQAELERDLESKKQVYQMAQALEQEGKLDRALDSYKSLHAQVSREIDSINVPGRFPAAISGSYSEKNTELKTLVEQRMKDIYFQYETEYRTQLVDAEQLIANQDYIRARETYDRILNAAPNFNDVRNKRAELYRRMISEARGIYHEALIYESVGDLQAAIDKYSQTKRLLGGIVHPSADEYFRKANAKLKDLLP
ncbi:MAG TPA: FHA domain-containing protein [Bdellovibrionota bacterium]|nr:FHA domain-containing protein [Bdellovibrionota bacterium]